MTDEPTCGYCGHPRGTHPNAGRCWNDVAGLTGWRTCTCPEYLPEEDT